MQQPRVARVHHSFLAVRERRLLTWLAGRVSARIKPDHLTLIGMAGALLCGASYAATAFSARFLWLAILGLAVNWLGDSLDGSLARYRGTERPRYGFFIDHTTDIASQVFIFLGLGLSPYMHLVTACLALMSYWIAALYTFIRALATSIFQISYWGVGPTEIRLALIAYNLTLLVAGGDALQITDGFSLIDIFCGFLFVLVFIAFLALIRHEGKRLAALDVSEPDKNNADAVMNP